MIIEQYYDHEAILWSLDIIMIIGQSSDYWNIWS